MMSDPLHQILSTFARDNEGVYLAMQGGASGQEQELRLREEVASKSIADHLHAISGSHSIPVMDREVDRFLNKMPENAVILDIGGCWGWHWRRIAANRPDVGLVVVDFVRSNLTHAKQLLGDLIERQVWLMHADATALPYRIEADFRGFDAVWTVQAFQHIPDFKQAVSEAHRVLKSGGVFINYSLNHQPVVALLYRVMGKNYVRHGQVDGAFWLNRASDAQKKCIQSIFQTEITERWTELLYTPELHLSRVGKAGSFLGKIDACLSNNLGLLGWLARQRSYECKKP